MFGYKDFTRLLRSFYKVFTRMLQHVARLFTRLSQGCYKVFTKLLEGFFKVFRTLFFVYKVFTWCLCFFHKVASRLVQGFHKASTSVYNVCFTRPLHCFLCCPTVFRRCLQSCCKDFVVFTMIIKGFFTMILQGWYKDVTMFLRGVLQDGYKVFRRLPQTGCTNFIGFV